MYMGLDSGCLHLACRDAWVQFLLQISRGAVSGNRLQGGIETRNFTIFLELLLLKLLKSAFLIFSPWLSYWCQSSIQLF